MVPGLKFPNPIQDSCMKMNILSRFLFAFAFAGAAMSATGADPVRYMTQPGGAKMRIDGTSTIHDWHAETKLIGGYVNLDGDFDISKAEAGKLNAKAMVIIPTSSFATSSGSAMDKVMRSAMKTDEHRSIRYVVTEMSVKSKNPDGSVALESKGNLSVSGVTKPTTLSLTMTAPEAGKLKFSGKTKVKMTDFGIKPPAPSVGLGLIKTGDEVTLTFEWTTRRKD